MFGWIKRLFGSRTPAPRQMSPEEEAAENAFHEAKQAALDAALGKMEEYVIHAIIPFFIGGGLDLYPFRRHIPGTVYVTQELFMPDAADRPKASRDGFFELAVAFREGAESAGKEMPDSSREASIILNPVARYAFEASLNPGETAEIPNEEGPNTCIVLDRLSVRTPPGSTSLSVQGEPFFVLLVVRVHPSELEFARAEGSAKLLERLKAGGYYPYSDLDRQAVA